MPPEDATVETQVRPRVAARSREEAEIRGAFGSIHRDDSGARGSLRQRLLTLAAIMGPGLIVMVGDNDAGGVATYAQAGQNYGTSLLWSLLLLVPVLIVNQEMVVRLGVVTGVGHARLIFERFGRFWGAFPVGDLFVLNFLTIVTEFIGVSLGAEYFGVSPFLAVPVIAALLIGITVSGNFQRWERAMFGFLVLSLVALPLAILAHPHPAEILHDTLVPGIRGGISANAVLLLVAIVGTTVAPWQLFFQQSNVIDKRITPRWMGYERADTVIGAVFVVVGAAALMMAAGFAFTGTGMEGQFTDAGAVARGLHDRVGTMAGDLFAVLLIDASIIGASAVTLATSYAFGDVFGIRHSLHRSWREARPFYLTYAATVSLAAAIVLIPRAPLGLITTAVQALAGILLPSATVFLLMLCNDREVLGPWVNRSWVNALAATIVGTLIVLSLMLVVTTLAPGVDVLRLGVALSIALLIGLLAAGVRQVKRPAATPEAPSTVDRSTWRMPPLALLGRPQWSRTRRVSMYALQAYLIIATTMLVARSIQIAGGH